MNLKRILSISLIIIVLASVSVVSAGLLNGEQDNVIEVDNVKFNTTNITKFTLYDLDEDEGGYTAYYTDENRSGYKVVIDNFSAGSGWDDFDWGKALAFSKNHTKDAPSQTVNGVVVYTTSANMGEHVGEPRYESYIENRDLFTIVNVGSPDPNETAKMALSLKFK